jgi:hypothetical protein
LVTAAQLNTHIRDNINETAPAKVTTAGDTVYATGANAITRLAVGANNKILKVASGLPSWQDPIEKVGLNRGTSILTLPTAPTWSDIPNLSLTVSAGTWLIIAGVEFFRTGAGDASAVFSARLLANGVAQSGTLDGNADASTDHWLLTGVWQYTAAGSEVVKMQAQKSGGTGTSSSGSQGQFIVAMRLA